MAKTESTAVTAGQLYCNRCWAPVVDCYQCGKKFTDREAIYCDDGRHVHTNCWEDYEKEIR